MVAKLQYILRECDFIIGTLIVHEAWDEPDSVNSTISSLHGRGLEATISVSETIPTLPMIERHDYNSDDSLLTTLASLALCTGFEYVKMNSDNTLSVAVSECFDDNTRYVLSLLILSHLSL